MLAFFGSKLTTYKTDTVSTNMEHTIAFKNITVMKFKKINKVLDPQLKLHQRSSDDLEK